MGSSSTKSDAHRTQAEESLRINVKDVCGVFKDACAALLRRHQPNDDLAQRIERRQRYLAFLDVECLDYAQRSTARYAPPWLWALRRMLEMCDDAVKDPTRIMSNTMRRPGRTALAETDLASGLVQIAYYMLAASAAEQCAVAETHTQTVLSMIPTWVSSFDDVSDMSRMGLVTVELVVTLLLLPYMQQGASYTLTAKQDLEAQQKELLGLQQRTQKAARRSKNRKYKKSKHASPTPTVNGSTASMASSRGYIGIPLRQKFKSKDRARSESAAGTSPPSPTPDINRKSRAGSLYGTFSHSESAVPDV